MFNYVRDKSLTVRITDGDIANGLRKDGYSCPLARAIRRQIGTLPFQTLCTYSRIGGEHWKHSQNGIDFIEKFDRGEPVAPVTVVLTRSPFIL